MRGSLLPRSYESKRDVARQRRALEKLSASGTGVMLLQRAYADLHDAYLVFRWGSFLHILDTDSLQLFILHLHQHAGVQLPALDGALSWDCDFALCPL